MTVIIILAPILVTAVQRIRERHVKTCFSAYMKMLDKLALMPKSFLIEGAFRHAKLEKRSRARLIYGSPWIQALAIKDLDLAIFIQKNIIDGKIPPLSEDDS